MMNLDHFTRTLDIHGADLSMWPQADVKPGLALMAASVEAKKMFREAERMDALLRDYRQPASDKEKLAVSILRATRFMPQKKQMKQAFQPKHLYVPGGGLVMAAVLGFMIGIFPLDHAFSLDPDLYTRQDQIISGIGEI